MFNVLQITRNKPKRVLCFFLSGTAMEEHAWIHPTFCMLGQEMLHQQDCQKVNDPWWYDIPNNCMAVGEALFGVEVTFFFFKSFTAKMSIVIRVSTILHSCNTLIPSTEC